MAILRHEVWEDYGDGGEALPGVCLAGPDGDGFRRLLAPTARLVHAFEAGSHHEAMTIRYSLKGWGVRNRARAPPFLAYGRNLPVDCGSLCPNEGFEVGVVAKEIVPFDVSGQRSIPRTAFSER